MARSKGPLLVLVAALVVIGAGAAGWFLFNNGEPTVTESTSPTPAPPVATKDRKAPALAPAPKVSVTEEKLVMPPVVKETIIDGNRHRDYRPEGSRPIDIPPAIHPPDARKMQPTSTAAISKGVRAALRECTQSIPATERSGRPKMDSLVVVAVKDKVATVTKTVVQLRDVSGPGADAAKACIEQKLVGQATPVDEEDLASYDISAAVYF